MVVDVDRRASALGAGSGGLSGPPLHPVAAALGRRVPRRTPDDADRRRRRRALRSRGRRVRARRRGRRRGRHRVARRPTRAVEGAATRRDGGAHDTTSHALGPEGTARWLTRSTNGSPRWSPPEDRSASDWTPLPPSSARGGCVTTLRAQRPSRGGRSRPWRRSPASSSRRSPSSSGTAAPALAALERVLADARAAGLLVIGDAKRGDISTTNEGYADAWLRDESPLCVDAMTVTCYLGAAALAPALLAGARERPRRLRRRRELERRGSLAADRARRAGAMRRDRAPRRADGAQRRPRRRRARVEVPRCRRRRAAASRGARPLRRPGAHHGDGRAGLGRRRRRVVARDAAP